MKINTVNGRLASLLYVRGRLQRACRIADGANEIARCAGALLSFENEVGSWVDAAIESLSPGEAELLASRLFVLAGSDESMTAAAQRWVDAVNACGNTVPT